MTWWHDLEGGPIGDARPPPPNADQPYPTLGQIPGKPPLLSAQARLHIANALVADRANAQYGAAMAPLPAAAPRPALPKPPPPAPGGEDVSSASMPAASPAPASAPTGPVQSASLPPAPSESALPGGADAGGADAGAGAGPVMPAGPPPPPNLPGVNQATTPTVAPVAPPPPPAPVRPLVAGAPAPVAFQRGSAALPTSAYAALKSLVQQRGGGSIAVVGFGDAEGADPAVQQAAMPLALARARAIATYLEASGVPAGALRIDAEAAGNGGLARLVN